MLTRQQPKKQPCRGHERPLQRPEAELLRIVQGHQFYQEQQKSKEDGRVYHKRCWWGVP